jgi:two-component system sensor histidine kinase ChvG
MILYTQFEEADRQTRELASESLRHHDWLLAQALIPVLNRIDQLSSADLNAALGRYAEDGTDLKLLLRPQRETGSADFYFIASAPAVSSDQFGPELRILEQQGVLKSLEESCSWDHPIEIRYRNASGAEEVLTSIIPINGNLGCWALVSAHNGSDFLSTAFGRPYWQTDHVRMAALVYVVLAALAGLIAISARRALRHFRTVAREIRRGGVGTVAFASRNILPELASVAADFDRLVEDLHRAASDIRRTAEEDAHALKAPLAVIRSALQPLKRAIPEDDQRAHRATQLIESAVTRLSTLISTAQRLGNNTADFIEAPKLRIDLTNVVAEGLTNARDISLERNIRFVRRLAEDVLVLAPDGILDIIVENILDNAISFSPDGGTITTTLSKTYHRIDLQIEDEGPGIDPSKIERIFDRNFSVRTSGGTESGEPEHAGLGLWIVRRHVGALGGYVTAANRVGGGLRVHVRLPGNGW